MGNLSLKDLSDKMAHIDFAMLTTRTDGGALAARPMSNNGDVEYKGDSFFFSDGDARTVQDIQRDPKVGLTFTGNKSLLGAPGIFIAIEGQAEPIRDKAALEEHWNKDLERWFADGVDTPGLVLIKVHADRISYWDGEDQGEVKV